MDFDLVIEGGTVIDGTGADRFAAAVGISDGRIAAVARDGTRLHGRRSVDAAGKVVAPGFVDSNSHIDWMAPLGDAQLQAPFLLQGITTSVGGGCGYSPAPVPPGHQPAVDRLSAFLHDGPFPYRWSSFGEFLAAIEEGHPLLNVAFMVGQNTVRDAILGLRPGVATRAELEAMRDLTRRALDEGAVGLSGNAGMRPGRFADNDELVALADVASRGDGVCAVHARAYTSVSDAYAPLGAPHNVRAVRDLIDVARRSRVRLQVSHLLFAGRRTWRTTDQVLAELDTARAEGIDIAFDAVPYTVGAGPLELLFPGWFVSRFPGSTRRRAAVLRLKAELGTQRALVGIGYDDVRVMASPTTTLEPLEGLDFSAIGRTLGVSPVDAEVHVARETDLGTMVMFDTCSGVQHDDQPLRSVLRDPSCAFVTNAVIRSHGARNPAAFGAFPHVLGHFSRELQLFTLEEAVRRMTSYPAARLGLPSVGRIAEGVSADVVVFDPKTVGAGDSDGRPTGIDTVIVSGHVAAAGGDVVPGPRHGRVLRRT